MEHFRKYRREYIGLAVFIPVWVYAIVTHTTGVWPRFDDWYNIAFNIAAILIWPIGGVLLLVRWLRRRGH